MTKKMIRTGGVIVAAISLIMLSSWLQQSQGLLARETTQPIATVSQENRNQEALEERQKVLESQGWYEQFDNEPAYIQVGQDQLRYYFGSPEDIGQDVAGAVHGKPISKGTNHLKIPNVDYVDKADPTNSGAKDKILQHLFMYPNTPWTVTKGFFTSQGLIVATKDSSGKRQSSIMKNTGSEFKLFEKKVNGLTAKKLVYIAKYHDSKYLDRQFHPDLLVETTMTGLPIGRVKIDQNVTNISNITYDKFMLGYSEDTKLGEDDDVLAYALGNNRGFYINYTDPKDKETYRLTYFVTEKDYVGLRPMDNWRAGHWTHYDDTRDFIVGEIGGWDGEETFFHYDPDPLKLNDFGAFNDIDSIGDEKGDYPADTAIQNYRYDTAISYKNQPISLEPTKSTSFSWLLGMDRESDGPEIKLDENQKVINRQSNVDITGNWRDLNSQEVSLEYSVDGGSRQPLGSVPNPDLNTWTPFTITLDSTNWKPGTHHVTVYGINREGKEAKAQTIVLEVTSRLTVLYKSLTGDDLTPVGATTLMEGVGGTSFSFALPDLLPLYRYDHVSIGQKINNTIEGIFPKEDEEIIVYYEAIPQTVVMTVNYYLVGTTTPIKDIKANNQPISSVKKSVPIGELLKPYGDEAKKDFLGYTFAEVEDSGNVPTSDFDLNFYYQGKLALENVPEDVTFETAKVISFGNKDIQLKQNVTMDVLDTLETNASWDIQLRVKEPLKTANHVEFKGKLKFLTSSQNLSLNNVGQTVFSKQANHIGYDSISWDKTKEGLYLEQAPGNLAESYAGKLEWTLTDGK